MHLQFGTITAIWSDEFLFPFAADHTTPEDRYYQQCDIGYWQNGGLLATTKKGFYFDGSSVPWLFRRLFGFTPKGVSLFAPNLHDFACINPHLISRVIGDGCFMEIAEHSPNVGRWKAAKYFAGIRMYSMAKWLGAVA